MKNIRLYIGGVRADLDSSVTIPFNYQTTDAESPTAVKNSYSKTVTLQGTETNRRLFGGLWHLDSLVRDWQPAPPPRFVAESSESDAEFSYRQTPALAVGDTLKAARILGRTIAWNQLVDSGTTSVTIRNGHKYYAIINGVRTYGTSTGAAIAVTGGTDIFIDLTQMFGSNEPTAAEFEALYPLNYYNYNAGELVSNAASGLETRDAADNVVGTMSLNLTSLTSGGVAVCPEGLKAADYAGTVCDETDGQVLKNRVGRVNLGDVTWQADGNGVFRCGTSIGRAYGSGNYNLRASRYVTYTQGHSTSSNIQTLAAGKDKMIFVNSGSQTFYIKDADYTSATGSAFKTAMNGIYLDYELATPVDYVLDTPIDTLCPFELGGTQVRLPEDTAADVQAPFRADFEYGRMIPYPEDEGVYFNPMKRVGFLLYVDEMIVERGYCQLTAINRKGRDYTFSVSLFGGLGEFFYNLQTDSDGESRTLADLDWGADLGFRINGVYVQNNWDDLLGGTLPTIAFVPMHNGVPSNIDADKALISGGGVPGSIVDGGTTYSYKNGYLLASLERKYTEWEIGDLRSYLQRPALRLKDFIAACCASVNNGGWTVDLDSEFFTNTNPYYEKTYILLPQLNVEEETEDICDDGSIDPTSDYPSTVTRTTSLDLSSGGCLTIVSDQVDMSASASNAYLKVSAPVQLSLTGVANQGGPLFLTNRVSHHTENKTICMMLAAWDDDGNLMAVSNRYVFTSKSHRMETGDVKKPAAPYSTSDAQIDGYFAWDSDENRYIFRADDNPANTFALTIDKVQRPSSTLHQVRIDFILQMTAQGIPTLNKMRYGYNSFNVPVSNTNFKAAVLSGSNNNITLVEPTQYATDSEVTQKALLSSLKETPLDILLSITKRFGLMWVQDNREKKVSLYMRKNYYTGAVRDIHDRIDYSKGLKATPVAAESNNYVLEDEYPETTLSKAYESDWGRVYGAVRLKTGYDFGKDKVEMMDKLKLKGYVDGALSGAGYWKFVNSGGDLPSAIAEGMKVTYYHESGGVTDTKDIDYNLFNVSSVQKFNSPALGVACMNDSGEEESKEVAPALVFFAGGQVPGIWHLTDDNSAMAQLNGGPCWIFDPSLATARVPQFSRVATFSGETYSLDYGTPRETYYIPEVSLAPEQAIYTRFWEEYLTDLLSRDTKKVECYVVFPPHLDMRQEMRKFYLFDRSLWVLNKITDYDPTKEQSVKCEFIRVLNREAYRK